MRCKNQGSGYDDENIQWTCTASLPVELKLGSTDVICEGYESSKDPYVLKGSCGVEYRLVLTQLGEEKYGRNGPNLFDAYKRKGQIDWSGIFFWGVFIFVIGWMLYAAFLRNRQPGIGRGGTNNPWGWGGGGGGGPGGDDQPPPYEFHSKPSSTWTRAAPRAAQDGWRPGFWSGALGGAAAGYLAGNRGQSRGEETWRRQQTGRSFWNNNDNSEGSSTWGGAGRTRSSSSSASSFSSTRHESSGFGSTSRR